MNNLSAMYASCRNSSICHFLCPLSHRFDHRPCIHHLSSCLTLKEKHAVTPQGVSWYLIQPKRRRSWWYPINYVASQSHHSVVHRWRNILFSVLTQMLHSRYSVIDIAQWVGSSVYIGQQLKLKTPYVMWSLTSTNNYESFAMLAGNQIERDSRWWNSQNYFPSWQHSSEGSWGAYFSVLL